MKSRPGCFNTYLCVALACLALGGSGCALLNQAKRATGSKKEQSTIRLYLEGQRADSTTSGTVLVTSNKFPYVIEREPFLDEGDLAAASLVTDPDGSFYIQLAFNEHGALLLDMYTASNKGKHIIVFSHFPTPGLKPEKHKKKADDSGDSDSGEPQYPPGTPRQKGWLAAVLIRQRISNGVFRFTPDASHAEGARIVRGLKNVIAKSSDAKSDKDQ